MANPAPSRFFFRTWILFFGMILLGVLLSVENYRRATRQDQAYVALEFARRVGIRHSMTLDTARHYEEAVATVGTYLAINPQTSREDFALVARGLIAAHPGFRTINWMPEVTRELRSSYEQAAAADLKRPFTFTYRAADWNLVPMPDHDRFYPIFYREPTFPGDPLIGYYSYQEQSDTSLFKARNTQKISIANGLAFFTDPSAGVAVIVDYPVLRLKDGAGPKDKAGSFIGIIRAVFHQKEFFQAIRGKPGSAMDMAFIDPDAKNPEQRLLDFSLADGESPSTAQAFPADYKKGLHIEQPFVMGDRKWSVVYLPKPGWAETQTQQHPLLQLLAGLIVTGFVSAIVFIVIRQRVTVEKLVAQRTRELDVSQGHLNTLLGTLPGALFRYRWDDKFTFLSLTDSIEQLTGYPAAGFLSGKIQLHDLIHKEDLDASLVVKKSALDSRQSYEVEFRIRTSDGRERWVLSRGRGVYDPTGALVSVEGLAIDITARKGAEIERLEMERKLHEGQKLESLGLLASGVAHDFSNLLLGIMGNVTLTRMHLPANSNLHPRLQKIEEAASQAAELCRQMLDFTGRTYTLLESVDLAELVKTLMPLLSHAFKGSTKLIIQGDENLASARADSVQLRQIIMNLVINAADAVDPENGVIKIVYGRGQFNQTEIKKAVTGSEIPPGEYVFVEVSDNGSGIPVEHLPKIFDPFFTTKPSGRGLGLASMLGVIRNHSGALLLHTELNKCTSFKILLPLA